MEGPTEQLTAQPTEQLPEQPTEQPPVKRGPGRPRKADCDKSPKTYIGPKTARREIPLSLRTVIIWERLVHNSSYHTIEQWTGIKSSTVKAIWTRAKSRATGYTLRELLAASENIPRSGRPKKTADGASQPSLSTQLQDAAAEPPNIVNGPPLLLPAQPQGFAQQGFAQPQGANGEPPRYTNGDWMVDPSGAAESGGASSSASDLQTREGSVSLTAPLSGTPNFSLPINHP